MQFLVTIDVAMSVMLLLISVVIGFETLCEARIACGLRA